MNLETSGDSDVLDWVGLLDLVVETAVETVGVEGGGELLVAVSGLRSALAGLLPLGFSDDTVLSVAVLLLKEIGLEVDTNT